MFAVVAVVIAGLLVAMVVAVSVDIVEADSEVVG